MYERGSLRDKIEEMRKEEIILARRRKELKAQIKPLHEHLIEIESQLNKLESERLAIERLFIKPKPVKVEKRKTVRRKMDKETAELVDALKAMGRERLDALFDSINDCGEYGDE